MLFSIVHNKIISTNELKTDSENISNWFYHWKMCVDEDPSKQAQEVVFCCEVLIKPVHPPLTVKFLRPDSLKVVSKTS